MERRDRKIDLDGGFSLGEAITFIERILGIKDRSQNYYLVELVEALNYLPLALRQATAYIKQEKINISEYLKRYNEAMQESNPDLLEKQGISKEFFTTLKVNFDKIKGEKNIGQRSCKILTAMAYLNPDQISVAEIFLRKKSAQNKQHVLDAFDLLNKFSLIELEKSVAKVHRGIQKTIRIEEERLGKEEETLRKIMTSLVSDDITNVSHIISVWSHSSKYKRLVSEFINSSYDGSTILHLLAKSGNEEIIKRILSILEEVTPNKLSEVINAADKIGRTPSGNAATYGHLETLKYFIEKGSNLYKANGDFSTLHLAAAYNQLEIFKHLIDNEHFEFNWLNKMGCSILYHALEEDNLDIVKCFVEYIIRKGGNVNLRNEDGENLLYYTAKGNRLNIAQYLIEKGAIVDPNDKNIINLLHCAVKNNRLNVVKCLVDKEVDINQYNEYGVSPLYCAAAHGHLEIVKYFMEKGVSVNHENFTTLLYCSVKDGFLNAIKCIVEIGIDTDHRDKDNIGPVHYATIYDHLEIVKYFMEKNICAHNDEITPLHWAAACGKLKIVKYFIDNKHFKLDGLDGLTITHKYKIHEQVSILLLNQRDVSIPSTKL